MVTRQFPHPSEILELMQFKEPEFHPSILRDASHIDTTTEIPGGISALPFGIAPTGFTRLMKTEREISP